MRAQGRLARFVLAGVICAATVAACRKEPAPVPQASTPKRAAAAPAPARDTKFLFVGAPPGMQLPLEEIAAAFQRARSVDVTVTYADSGELRKKIEARDPMDVFVTAVPRDLDALSRAGRVGEPRWLGRDWLVVAVPRSSPRTPKTFRSLTRSRYKRIAIGDPAGVMSGAYAVSVFRAEGVYAKLQPKLVYLPADDDVIERVSTGQVQAGVVYRTQALAERRGVRMAFRLPTRSGQRIVYGAAPTAYASNPALATEFTTFLRNRQSRTILRKYGFGPPPRKGRLTASR